MNSKHDTSTLPALIGVRMNEIPPALSPLFMQECW